MWPTRNIASVNRNRSRNKNAKSSSFSLFWHISVGHKSLFLPAIEAAYEALIAVDISLLEAQFTIILVSLNISGMWIYLGCNNHNKWAFCPCNRCNLHTEKRGGGKDKRTAECWILRTGAIHQRTARNWLRMRGEGDRLGRNTGRKHQCINWHFPKAPSCQMSPSNRPAPRSTNCGDGRSLPPHTDRMIPHPSFAQATPNNSAFTAFAAALQEFTVFSAAPCLRVRCHRLTHLIWACDSVPSRRRLRYRCHLLSESGLPDIRGDEGRKSSSGEQMRSLITLLVSL